MKDIYLVGGARTPMGGFQGALSSLSATELGAVAIRAAVERAGLGPARVEEVIMGCVLPAGLGQGPARQAALAAGLPEATGCTTINKLCGSGMKAVMLAHDLIRAGSNAVMVAGGMESMSNAPYLLPKARAGLRMGHAQAADHMFLDGLEDARSRRLMGSFAEEVARREGIERRTMDAYAIESLRRARHAINQRLLEAEIVPVRINTRQGTTWVRDDEQPLAARADRIPGLKPAFAPDGSITAANASSISDGASALLLMDAAAAIKMPWRPWPAWSPTRPTARHRANSAVRRSAPYNAC